MVAAVIQLGPEGAGPKVQAFSNTVNAVADTRTQAACIVNEFGVPMATLANPNFVQERPSVLGVTVTAATGVAATLTIPAPGAGLFQYITSLEINLYATAARTGAAAPIVVTSTNLPGTPAWTFETAQAIGTMIRTNPLVGIPLKAVAANTAVTIVAPIATAGLWRITAFYYNAA